MNFLLEIYYYLFYRLAKFAKEIFDYGDYLFWGALISTALIWNYITTVIEWVLGVLHLQHNDWYYIIIGIAATVILWRYVLTEERYTVHSYDIDPHSYDVDPLEEGRAFKEQSLFACKQAAA